jgi:hypothetical protein
MSTGIEALRQSADLQRVLFYEQFMASGKVGEITCVNGPNNDDTFLYERFEDFIVSYRLLGEDSMNVLGKTVTYHPVQEFVDEKAEEQSEKYKQFLHNLVLQKKSIDDVKEEIEREGGDPAMIDFIPFTRYHLEEMLAPGRKRINGDRKTRIQIMCRSKEIPNDLQLPAVWVYVLPMPDEVKYFYESLASLDERKDWENHHLQPMIKDFEVGCHLPILKQVIDVYPKIYRFPEKEVQVENI